MKALTSVTLLASLATAGATHADETLGAAQLAALDRVGREIAASPCVKPKAVREKSQPNIHEPHVTDQIVRFECQGVVAEIYRANASQPARDLPLEVRLTVNNRNVPARFAVGASLAGVRRALGSPTTNDNGAATYPLSAERPDQDTISFVARHGIIRAIVWSWAVD